jgi:ATP-dependent DNA ligase
MRCVRNPTPDRRNSLADLQHDKEHIHREPPPRGTRFGSPPVLSRVHWVRPEMAVEVSYVEWTPDGLLRHVVYLGAREDKLATEVHRTPPHVGEI